MVETKTRAPEQNRSLQRRTAYPSLFTFSPFEVMRRLSDEMFRSVLGSSQATAEQGLWAPRIEAFQEGNEFLIRAELPGTNPDDVAVDVSEDAVTISGDRRQEHQERRGGAVISEISYGAFSRVVPLPDGVIADSATATFRDGVLEIRMPATPSEVTRGRRLEISKESGKGQSNQGQTASQAQTQPQSQSSGSTDQSSEKR